MKLYPRCFRFRAAHGILCEKTQQNGKLEFGGDAMIPCHCEERSDVAIRIPLELGSLFRHGKENGLPRQCAHWLAMTCYYTNKFQFSCLANDTERGAPRSESEISMIAGGNHTIMNIQWRNDTKPPKHALPAGASPPNSNLSNQKSAEGCLCALLSKSVHPHLPTPPGS